MLRVILIAGCLWGAVAHAQTSPCGGSTPSDRVCLWWVAPTEYERVPGENFNRPIAAGTVITYRIYEVAGGTRTFRGQTNSLTLTLVALRYGDTCWVATATVNGRESADTRQVCKLLRPRAPTEGGIETQLF